MGVSLCADCANIDCSLGLNEKGERVGIIESCNLFVPYSSLQDVREIQPRIKWVKIITQNSDYEFEAIDVEIDKDFLMIREKIDLLADEELESREIYFPISKILMFEIETLNDEIDIELEEE